MSTSTTVSTSPRRRRLQPQHVLMAAHMAAGIARVLHRSGEAKAAGQAVRYYRRTPRFPQ